MTITILYEDNHLLVAKKESQTLIKHKTKKNTLKNKLNKKLTSREEKDQVWIKNLRLIDNHVGGTALFAKSSKAYTRLRQQLKKQKIRQMYFAVVNGMVAADFGTVTNHVMKSPDKRLHIVDSQNPYGEQSTFSYYVVDRSAEHTLLAIPTKTGITKQIRAQLKNMGHSVYGDRRYGKNCSKQIPLALWSVQLRCYHPTLKKKISIVSSPPSCYPWSEFDHSGQIDQAIENVYRKIKYEKKKHL